MNHPLFGALVYRKADQEWTGAVTLRPFATFGATSDESEAPQRQGGALPILIRDPTGAGPRPEQEAAFRAVKQPQRHKGHEDASRGLFVLLRALCVFVVIGSEFSEIFTCQVRRHA